jgi:ATPase subunit of ABC transporter with duplicated ATPase domains
MMFTAWLQELARKEAMKAAAEEEKRQAIERAKQMIARKRKPKEQQDMEEEADTAEAERVAMMHEPSLRRTKHVPPTHRLSALFFRLTANRVAVVAGLPANVSICADVTTEVCVCCCCCLWPPCGC